MKCKLSPQEFWALSWYEWHLYIERYKEEAERDRLADEVEWLRTRALWVPIMNANFKKPGGYSGTDLIVLSFDKDEEKEDSKPITLKDAKALLGSKIKKDG